MVWWCCGSGLVRFRHKDHVVMVKIKIKNKNGRRLTKNTFSHQKNNWKCPDVSLKTRLCQMKQESDVGFEVVWFSDLFSADFHRPSWQERSAQRSHVKCWDDTFGSAFLCCVLCVLKCTYSTYVFNQAVFREPLRNVPWRFPEGSLFAGSLLSMIMDAVYLLVTAVTVSW